MVAGLLALLLDLRSLVREIFVRFTNYYYRFNSIFLKNFSNFLVSQQKIVLLFSLARPNIFLKLFDIASAQDGQSMVLTSSRY